MSDELKKEEIQQEEKQDTAKVESGKQAASQSGQSAEAGQKDTGEQTAARPPTDSGADSTRTASTDEGGVTEEQKEEKQEESEENLPTFSGEPSDKVYSLDELDEASEEYEDSEFHKMMEMYESTLSSITEKEILTGRVLSKDEKYVIVDIGFKSEGIIPLNEFREPDKIEPGDEVEVFLDRVEDREGQLVLSRRKANTLRTWEKIEHCYEYQEVIEGYIKRRIKGGMVVDIFGIDAFLPGSQIDVRPVRDFDAYVGKTMEFMIVKLNMSSENVVVSHRALVESDLEEQREQILASMEPGQILEGSVKNITDFGVFIDLGGVDGLLHITDLSWGRVEHPSEIVKLDQKLNVVVLEFDDERKRISLGLKQLQPHPWDEIDDKYPENIKVQGKVVSIADYGAFIELEKGVEGLVHISEMSWTQHIKHPSQLVEKNQVIECVVLNINKNEKKVSLGVKQLQSDPWDDLLDRYPIGSKHKGVVRNLTNFGVFVELEPGIDGLVHISDLSWTRKINHPSEVVSKGDELEVAILSVDFDNRRISLGHKQIDENPWEKFAAEYAPGNEVEGEVTRISEKGVFVRLPLGVEAFLPKREAAESENFKEKYKDGDTVKAVVTEFDENSKNITISEARLGQAAPVEQSGKSSGKSAASGKKKSGSGKSTGKSSESKTASGALTLGEMSGLENLRDRLSEQKEEAGQQETGESEQESDSQEASGEKQEKKSSSGKASSSKKSSSSTSSKKSTGASQPDDAEVSGESQAGESSAGEASGQEDTGQESEDSGQQDAGDEDQGEKKE